MTSAPAQENALLMTACRVLKELLPEPSSSGLGSKVVQFCGLEGALSVDLSLMSAERPLLWIAGAGVTAGRFDPALETIDETELPPSHPHCSERVKAGPTQFAYLRSADDLLAVADHVRRLADLHALPDGPHLATLRRADGDADEPVESWLDRDLLSRKVLTQAKDWGIRDITDQITRGRVILQPDFQRQFVWSKAKVSGLIESILLNIPLPVIYVAQTEDSRWEVVDGQQRLTAIASFREGRYKHSGETCRLTNLRALPELKGKTYSDLPEELQHRFDDYQLRVIQLLQDADPGLKFDVFERLNTGADKLNDMELRNCIYRGPYNDLLADLATNRDLLAIRGETEPHPRLQDRQWILRFFAMRRATHLNYKGGMKRFLNREMEEHRDPSPAELASLKSAFEDAISCAYTVFGERAFRSYVVGNDQNPNGKWAKSKTINLALWDTLMYGFSRYERRQIVPVADSIREAFMELLATDRKFIDYISRTTDGREAVQYRAVAWLNRLEMLVDVPRNERRCFDRATLEAMWDRDATCGICTQKIMHIEDATVDHLEHYWRGGPTEASNGRLTHRYCNLRRGGRSDEEVGFRRAI